MLENKNVINQVINIGPDEEFITINKLAEICTNLTGFNQKPIYYKDRPSEVKEATCSSDKARDLLDYKTRITLEEGIKKLMNILKKEAQKILITQRLKLK